jgi:hypothetical protein
MDCFVKRLQPERLVFQSNSVFFDQIFELEVAAFSLKRNCVICVVTSKVENLVSNLQLAWLVIYS